MPNGYPRASIDKAMVAVREFEGGYSNDSDDPGGETYVGISRRYFPDWYGWKIIDARKTNGIPDSKFLAVSVQLNEAINDFYAQNFWNRFRGNEIDEKLQKIANLLMLAAIHCGVHQAVKFLQESLNVLNKNGDLYADLVVDGEMGNNTLSTFNKFAGTFQKDIQILHWIFAINYARYLIGQMKASPVKEKYARGWITRVMGE